MATAGSRVKALDFVAPVSAFDLTLFTNLPTTAAAGTPSVSLTFVAPTSGQVMVVVAGFAWDSATVNEVIVDYEIRVTNVGGAIVFGPGAWERRLSMPCPVATGNSKTNASKVSIVSGLTPGATYFARTMHLAAFASAGSNLQMRRLDVVPL